MSMNSCLALVLNELSSTKRVSYADFVSDSSAVVPLAAALVAVNWNHEEDEEEEQLVTKRRRREVAEEGEDSSELNPLLVSSLERDQDEGTVIKPRPLPPICNIEDATFREHFGMNKILMEKLFRDINTKIFSVADTRRGKGFFIPSPKKVLLTVWLLCTRESFREVADRFGVSKGGLHVVFINTCVLIKQNSDAFIRWPNEDEQRTTARVFESKHGFPGVVGAVGECVIKNSLKCGSKVSSAIVVLQGACDASQRFFDVFVSDPMDTRTSRVFKRTPLSTRLDGGLSAGEDYHLIGDLSYPFTKSLLVPFDGHRILTHEPFVYNKVHEETYGIVGETFARLVRRFKRLDNLHMSRGDLVTTVVRVACCLHNFIVEHEREESSSDFDAASDDTKYPPFVSDAECERALEKRDLIASLLYSREQTD